MNLRLLQRLLLILAVLISAPGFAMSANHDACSAPVSVSAASEEHHSVTQQQDTAAEHCMSTSHCVCMLCFSVIPSITLSVAKSVGHESYNTLFNRWLSLSPQPEPHPPRNHLV
ncbi:hypothetical protein QQ39_03565 [Pragia fontium]|nr:hypothetical protein QQ39_03565 [Pragia fontium]